MNGGTPSASKLHFVLERISSIFRSRLRERATEQGLKLVQLEALIYLSVANRYSNTAGALTEYLGVTKGTASQTVIALERRGLATKMPDANDGRILHCSLTAKGVAIAQAARPASFLAGLTGEMQDEALAASLRRLRLVQAGRGFKSFGQCKSCSHFRGTRGRYQCGLTKESLTAPESLQICREHKEAHA